MPKNRFTDFNLDPALAEAVESAPDHHFIEGIVRLEDPTQVPPEFHVVCQFIRICTGRFLAEDTWTIRQHPNVVSLKAARPLGISEGETLLDFDTHAGRLNAGSLPFKGRGSIVAALDFGLDFGHPNFIHPDGTTRVLSFWHQGAPYDAAHPNRYGYGRVFTSDEINAALRTPDPYRALGYHPSISDTGNGSHGTHTLDIAAGNGRAQGSIPGIAPEAEIIFVHLSTPRLGVVGNLGDSVRMLEALDFAHRTAADRPCVVNLSVGREAGSHDATSPFEQAMHELLRMGTGVNRAICQSAGNYGSAHLAVNGWLRDGEQRDLEWIVHPEDVSPEIDAWYSGNDRFLVMLLPPDGGDPVEVRLGEVAEIRHNDALVGRIYHRKNDPNNRDHHVEAFLYKGAPPGVWRLRLIGEYVIKGRFHAWIERGITGAQSSFNPKITSRSYTLGTIATSPLVITVGAYDSNRAGNPLATFSSCGPTRDERQDKPELLAPGVRIVAARSIPRGATSQQGLLMPRSGTSMATPHVTGLVAAMFEAAGRPLSITEIRDCLKQSAEPATDADSPNCCSWGRVNMEATMARIRNLNSAAMPRVQIDASKAARDYADAWDQACEAPSAAPANYASIDHLLDQAEQAVRSSYGKRGSSEISFLKRLWRGLEGNVPTAEISPSALFRAALRDKELMNRSRNVLEVLATASQRLPKDLRSGDWMIRALPGTGDVGHISVLSSDNLLTPSALAACGIAAESEPSGYYGLVVEAGASPHTRSRPFARRLLDSRGLVPPYTVFLRPRYSVASVTTTISLGEPDTGLSDPPAAALPQNPAQPQDPPAPGPLDIDREKMEAWAGRSYNTFGEDASEQAQPPRFRIVFYDQDSLRYLDGWTRATGPSAVFLIDRPSYEPLRADGLKRGHEFDQFVAQALRAGRRGMDMQPPMFVIDSKLATVPLNRASKGDWDDLMIGQLIGASHQLTIQSETDQWKMIDGLFAKAKDDAGKAARDGRAAREFAAYMVLDTIKATLVMAEATVTMGNGDASIPLGQVHGSDHKVVPGSDAQTRVIGDIHTHYLLDPLINLNSTSVGTTIRSSVVSVHSGVSDIDFNAARKDQIVKYAVDSKYLHRANPNGTKNDELPRSGDVLREALRIFGGEPGSTPSG